MFKTITTIIPAYNEERHIKKVLKVAKKALDLGIISEIIVVDDGSQDKTAKIAENFKVKVLHLPENKGKAQAMAEGLKIATGEITIFIDADLINLKVYHLKKLIKPLLKNKNYMTIARFTNGRLPTDLAHILNIGYSGQRAAKTEAFRKIFKKIKNIEKIKYGIESIINDRAEELKIKTLIVEWPGVSQVMKEEKHGLILGLIFRLKMYFSMGLGHLRNLKYRIYKLLNMTK